jgi:hypothetical protein
VDLRPLEPVVLDVTGALHPTTHHLGTHGLLPIGQVAIANRRDLDVDVDPVQELAGYR